MCSSDLNFFRSPLCVEMAVAASASAAEMTKEWEGQQEPLVFLIFLYFKLGQPCCSSTHHPFHTPMPVLLDNVTNLESMLKFILMLEIGDSYKLGRMP